MLTPVGKGKNPDVPVVSDSALCVGVERMDQRNGIPRSSQNDHYVPNRTPYESPHMPQKANDVTI